MVLYNFYLTCVCGRKFNTTTEESLTLENASELRLRLHQHADSSTIRLDWKDIEKLPVNIWSAGWTKDFKVKTVTKATGVLLRPIVEDADLQPESLPGSSTRPVNNTADDNISGRVRRLEEMCAGFAIGLQKLAEEMLQVPTPGQPELVLLSRSPRSRSLR